VVVRRDQTPAVWLLPGEHLLTGRFVWPQRPEVLPLPDGLGLIRLIQDGRETGAPQLDDQNRLWLKPRPSASEGEGRTRIKVFRLFKDLVPMQVTTVFQVAASGGRRDLVLEGALLDGATAMAIDSPLPARLDGQGRLVVQAPPGQWQIALTARLSGPQSRIEALETPNGDEIWSFEPHHSLRLVEIAGAPAVEPGQTDMPEAWRSFPAFRVKQGEGLVFKEVRRGDPEPAPDTLTLHRTWWLDFDGLGFSVHDRVGGTISRQWYLAMDPPMQLGRVAVDGRDQVISAQGAEGKPGVQLRGGRLDLQADARWPRSSPVMPVAGWDHDFQHVEALMHLPPGWQLIGALGVDQVSSTWIQRWSLLDIFLALIIALAVYKLQGWRWGLLALIVMTLIFHEPGAPVLVWVHLLAVLALRPLLPPGWIRRGVTLWGAGALVVLLVTAVPFMVNQIRWGAYPHLAPPGDDAWQAPVSAKPMRGVAIEEEVQRDLPRIGRSEPSQPLSRDKARPARETTGRSATGEFKSAETLVTAAPPVDQPDPDALVPTGPGLPNWQWRTVSLGWSGPLAKAQTMRLFLLPPWAGLLLAVARVLLLALVIRGVFLWQPWWGKLKGRIGAQVVTAVLLGCFFLTAPSRAVAAGDDFPPPEMLDELRQRLLQVPPCAPVCADIARMELLLTQERLQIKLQVHVADRTAVPLPVNRESWTPAQILVDDSPTVGLARDAQGQLWALLEPGVHVVVLLGPVENQNEIQIPLPLKPHAASVQADGWQVKGLAPDGGLSSALQLERVGAHPERAVQDGVPPEKPLALPPFLHVERTLRLGLTWQVNTRVRRLTPTGAPVAVNIPLLGDESVTTPNIAVTQGKALIALAPDQREAAFDTTLPVVPAIDWVAPQGVPWSETWILEAAAIWQCSVDGIAPIHHQDRSGQWRPQWQPWPGERVTIRISRPSALPGPTKTIDQADLVLNPGQRFGTGELTLSIRTSRGGPHTVTLPDQAVLQTVRIDGKSLPVQPEGRQVTVPLNPGSRQLHVAWQWPTPFGALFQAPEVHPGQETVNARVTVNLPSDRWILLVGGPRWGPAVLFWSYLAVVVLFAAGLGRVGVTPLKTGHWLLLGLGLTQIPAVYGLIIVGWLVALGVKTRRDMPAHWLPFNAVQAATAALSAAALVCLFAAVKAGLIGQPLMHIVGNDSTYQSLHWVMDRTATLLPRPWVFSLPVWVYRGLMLAWSLWLALALLRWLKWGWGCFAREGVWRKSRFKLKKGRVKEPGPEGESQ